MNAVPQLGAGRAGQAARCALLPCTAVGEGPTAIPSTQLPLEPHRGPAGWGALQGQAGMGAREVEGCACGLVAAQVQPQPLGPWRGKLSTAPPPPPSPSASCRHPHPAPTPRLFPWPQTSPGPFSCSPPTSPLNDSQLLAAPQNTLPPPPCSPPLSALQPPVFRTPNSEDFANPSCCSPRAPYTALHGLPVPIVSAGPTHPLKPWAAACPRADRRCHAAPCPTQSPGAVQPLGAVQTPSCRTAPYPCPSIPSWSFLPMPLIPRARPSRPVLLPLPPIPRPRPSHPGGPAPVAAAAAAAGRCARGKPLLSPRTRPRGL